MLNEVPTQNENSQNAEKGEGKRFAKTPIFEFLSAKKGGVNNLSRVHKGFRIYLKYEQAGPNFSFNRGKKGGATLIIHDYLNACKIRGFSLIAPCRLCWEDPVQWVNDFGPT